MSTFLDIDADYVPQPGVQVVLIYGGGLGGGKAELIRGLLEAQTRGKGVHVAVANPTHGGWVKAWFDEYADVIEQSPATFTISEPSQKRKNLIAQLNRAKLQRNKNLVRDLTRQLEQTP